MKMDGIKFAIVLPLLLSSACDIEGDGLADEEVFSEASEFVAGGDLSAANGSAFEGEGLLGTPDDESAATLGLASKPKVKTFFKPRFNGYYIDRCSA